VFSQAVEFFSHLLIFQLLSVPAQHVAA